MNCDMNAHHRVKCINRVDSALFVFAINWRTKVYGFGITFLDDSADTWCYYELHFFLINAAALLCCLINFGSAWPFVSLFQCQISITYNNLL